MLRRFTLLIGLAVVPAMLLEPATAQAPNVPAPPAARDSASDLTYWNAVQAADNCDAARAYIQHFPSGVFVELARLAERRLCGGSRAIMVVPAAPALLPAPPPPPPAAMLPPPAPPPVAQPPAPAPPAIAVISPPAASDPQPAAPKPTRSRWCATCSSSCTGSAARAAMSTATGGRRCAPPSPSSTVTPRRRLIPPRRHRRRSPRCASMRSASVRSNAGADIGCGTTPAWRSRRRRAASAKRDARPPISRGGSTRRLHLRARARAGCAHDGGTEVPVHEPAVQVAHPGRQQMVLHPRPTARAFDHHLQLSAIKPWRRGQLRAAGAG